MRIRLPYRALVETAGRLRDRFGLRWFTVVEAGHVIDVDGVIRTCRDPKRYRDTVRRRLHRMVDRGLLLFMRHPAPHTRRATPMFRISSEGKKLVDLYRQHSEAQRDMDDILDLL